jgi:hypothetical protein
MDLLNSEVFILDMRCIAEEDNVTGITLSLILILTMNRVGVIVRA